jgi:hypothetical protein
MNRTLLYNFIRPLALATAMTVGLRVGAGEPISPASFTGILSATPAAELPGRAAELVAQADPKTLRQTTVAVVKAAVSLNPAAAPAVVGSITQTTAVMGATAAAAAAVLVPDLAPAIARAAAATDPARAGMIVKTVCRALPTAYVSVAVAVAEVVPGADRDILAGVAAALPQLQAGISKALAGPPGSQPLVRTVLAEVPLTAAPGPAAGAALIPAAAKNTNPNQYGGGPEKYHGLDTATP